MYAIDIYILYFLGLYPVCVYDRLGFRRCDIFFKYNSVLANLHVFKLPVFIVLLGNTKVVKNDVIGIWMGEAEDDIIFVIHADNFSGFLKGHVGTLELTLVKQKIHVAVVQKQQRMAVGFLSWHNMHSFPDDAFFDENKFKDINV